MIMNFWKETGNSADDAMNETISFMILFIVGFSIGGFSLPYVMCFINYLISLI